jgi:glycine betaine transporter
MMPHVRKILVPIDFSEHSAKALAYAVDLATRFDAHILVLHVWEPPRTMGLEFGIYPIEQGSVLQILEEETTRRAQQFVAEQAKPEGLRLDTLAVQGVPYDVIVDIAESRHIDLIVMGTHGRSGLSRFFLGSVAEKVVRHAHCPVLTIRERASLPEQRA